MRVLQFVSECKNPIIKVNNLRKVFGDKNNQVVALKKITVGIEKGSLTAIMGPSGSGKSTFMHCVAGLDRITDGTVCLADKEISCLNERKLTRFRREEIGFVFQSFNLIPTLTAAENIRLPMEIAHRKIDEDFYQTVIGALDLGERLKHKPAELSGGQQQRVACARALLQKPKVLFADEPTGNLDSSASEQVLRFLRQCVDEFGQTVVMVTHEPESAAWADRVLFLKDGELIAQLDNPTQTGILRGLEELSENVLPQVMEVEVNSPVADAQVAETVASNLATVPAEPVVTTSAAAPAGETALGSEPAMGSHAAADLPTMVIDPVPVANWRPVASGQTENTQTVASTGGLTVTKYPPRRARTGSQPVIDPNAKTPIPVTDPALTWGKRADRDRQSHAGEVAQNESHQ